MKICLTVNSSPWSRFKGGGQIAAHHLADALVRQGHAVHVIYSKTPEEKVEVDAQYAIHWARHLNFATLNFNIFTFAFVLWRLLARERFDVIHGNAEEAFFFPFIARIFRARYVFTSHAPFIPETSFWGGLIHPLFSLKRLNSFLLRAAAKKARTIFTFSRFSKNLVIKALGNEWEDRIEVIMPGIDTRWFECERNSSSRPELIFWGRIEDEKGIPELLQALKQVKTSHPEILLHLIGEGNKLENYRKSADEWHLLNEVVFHGWMDPSKIRSLAATCQAGVFPSRIESFGLAVAEAMAAGLPVITTTAGALPEIVENGVTGILVPPEKSAPLAKAIQKLLFGDFPIDEIAAAGRAKVLEKYSWDHAAMIITRFYQSQDNS